MKVSAVVLTYNEEINIKECITSLKKITTDIVVLDSFSSDKTVALAHRENIRVIQNGFEGYAKQRNFAMNEIEYEHDWLLMLDADERLTDEIIYEINNLDCSENTTLFRFRRKDYFLGKWIRRSSGYPTWFGRLLKRGHVTIDREINEEYKTPGNISYLNEHIVHYPFNKGFSSWFDKHNRYSTMEAELFSQGNKSINFADLFSRDPAARRATLKSIIYSLPLRPVVVFFLLYFLRLGVLDGKAGFTFCCLRSIYEYMIDCKLKEIKLRKLKLPI